MNFLLGMGVYQFYNLFVDLDLKGHDFHWPLGEQKQNYFKVTHPEIPWQIFKTPKPQNEFRTIVLGGSQAMGTPYVFHNKNIGNKLQWIFDKERDKISISYWLSQMLPSVIKNKDIKVINLGMAGGSIIKVKKLLIDNYHILRPDLVIIITGNNERYKYEFEKIPYKGDNPILKVLYESGLILRGKSEAEAKGLKENLKIVKSIYKRELEEVLSFLENKKVKTYALPAAVNTKDWFPYAPEDDIKKFVDIYKTNPKNLIKNLPLIKKQMNSIEIFFAGKVLLDQKREKEAKEFLELSLEIDKAFLRNRPGYKNILKEVAIKHKAIFLDLQRELEKLLNVQVIGNEIFLDYCHYNPKGNFLVASLIMNDLSRRLKFNIDFINEFAPDGFEKKFEYYSPPSKTEQFIYIIRWFKLYLLTGISKENFLSTIEQYKNRQRPKNLND